MIYELNNSEYRKVMYGFQNAKELMDQALYKQAQLELRPGLRILEKKAVATPILEKYYRMLSEIKENLNDPEQAAYYAGLADSTAKKLQG